MLDGDIVFSRVGGISADSKENGIASDCPAKQRTKGEWTRLIISTVYLFSFSKAQKQLLLFRTLEKPPPK